MRREEFFQKLAERCGNHGDKTMPEAVAIEDISEFIFVNGIDGIKLDLFFSLIKKNHIQRRYPLYGELQRWWDEHGRENASSGERVIQTADRDLSAMDIIRRSRELKKRMFDNERLGNDEVDFIHRWDELFYVASSLRSAGWDMQRLTVYLEKVKESILRGEKINYGAFQKVIKPIEAVAEKRVRHISKVMNTGYAL